MTAIYHLAELNIARALYPLDDPRMADFVAKLGEINALAERSEGFVWRLQDESGATTSFRFGGDPLILVNFSVWTSVEALQSYVFRSGHIDVWKRRREWFHEAHGIAQTVMWWIEAGTVPTLEEAERRLTLLRTSGPTAAAFTFKDRFPPP